MQRKLIQILSNESNLYVMVIEMILLSKRTWFSDYYASITAYGFMCLVSQKLSEMTGRVAGPV